MDFDFQKELATLIKSVLGGSYLQVPGNGDQIIYPVFVSDVVYGLTKAMFTTRTGGKIFTLIGSEKISYFDLAQKLKKLSGKSLQLKFVAEKEGALRVESAIFKSQKKLGWKSKVKINKGLKRTLVYFQQQSDQLLKVARRPRFTSWGVIGKKPEIRSIGRMAGKVSLVLIPLLIMALPLLLPFFYFYSGTRNLKPVSYTHLTLPTN